MRKLAFLAAALALIGAARAEAPAAGIGEEALKRHIAVLADDAMEARLPGTPGAERAVAYIAAQFQGAGLEPAGSQSWYQPVELIERRPGTAEAVWRARRGRKAIAPGSLLLISRTPIARLRRAPVVFAGYGLEENVEGVNLDGAVVLILPGKPERRADAPSLDERRAMLARRGAKAVLTLIGDGAWAAVKAQGVAGKTMLADAGAPPIEGAVAAIAIGSLAKASGNDLASLATQVGKAGFRAERLSARMDIAVTTAVRSYATPNVVGRIRGTDAGGEAVVLTAHWDHLGLCRPEGEADRICNGAIDNASGVAVLIEVARALAAGERPPRDIVFVATTAEEMGLLGARAFVAHPPAGVGRIVAALNLDTVAIAPRGKPLAIINGGRTPIDPIAKQVAASMGRTVDGDEEANAFIARQDGYAFTRAGIPAVMVGGAFSDMGPLNGFLEGHYHGPKDEIGGIALGGAAEDADFHVALARALADPKRFAAVQP